MGRIGAGVALLSPLDGGLLIDLTRLQCAAFLGWGVVLRTSVSWRTLEEHVTNESLGALMYGPNRMKKKMPKRVKGKTWALMSLVIYLRSGWRWRWRLALIMSFHL